MRRPADQGVGPAPQRRLSQASQGQSRGPPSCVRRSGSGSSFATPTADTTARARGPSTGWSLPNACAAPRRTARWSSRNSRRARAGEAQCETAVLAAIKEGAVELLLRRVPGAMQRVTLRRRTGTPARTGVEWPRLCGAAFPAAPRPGHGTIFNSLSMRRPRRVLDPLPQPLRHLGRRPAVAAGAQVGLAHGLDVDAAEQRLQRVAQPLVVCAIR